MSYLKLCQILNQSINPDVIHYQEDCNGVVLVNNPTYPMTFNCEVIDWESEDEFAKRGKVNSFIAVDVTLNVQPVNIRDAIYQQLLLQYPELIK